MKTNLSNPRGLLFFLVLFLLSSTSLVQAQKDNICKDGDCPTELFNIKLDEPLNTSSGTYSSQRTDKLIQAYKDFQKTKSTYANSSSWKIKFESSLLGGKSCLRHYQLESRFGNEYVQNPDFKKYIDANASNADSFEKDGFKNARKGNNLKTRMKSKCGDEAKEADQGVNPQDLPLAYQALGTKLGYFDKQGNILKSVEESTFIKDLSNLSKKKQVEELKERVKALPIGQAMKDKIGGLKSGLKRGLPKLGLFKKAMGLMNSRLATFLPGPMGMIGKIKTGLGILKTLKKFTPKKMIPNLLSRIGNLFKRGEGLRDRAKDLDGKAKGLKDKFDQLTKKGKKLEDDLTKRIDKINDLENKLKKLQDKKDELTNKLADKPKKILDDLKLGVNDLLEKSKDLTEEVDKENGLKDKILKEIEALTKEKEDLEKETEEAEKELEDLAKEQDSFEKETQEVEAEVEEIKKEEAKIEELKKELEELKPEKEIEAEITDCESELKKLLNEINGVEAVQENIKKKKKGIFSLPGKLKEKISSMKLFQGKLKLGKKGIPLVGKALAKVDNLIEKSSILANTVEGITGKEIALDEKLNGFGDKLNNIKSTYESKVANIDNLKKELLALITEKSGLKDELEGAEGSIDKMDQKVKDFVKRYNIFDENSDCVDKQEEEKEEEVEVEEIKKEQEEIDEELDEIEEELKTVNEEADVLETETKEVVKEIEEEAQKVEQEAEKLIKEEEAIKKEYGTEVKLEPVTVEEWSESFEIKRPYWDAVFHPDDEVVEGFKGRYFEVRLKDAEKDVKLLFGPGEYSKSKSDFRKTYGSTIGAFVTEALHTMKETDQDQVKLFIQGSADIAGHKTFSGRQNDDFLYNEINVLPQKGSDDSFAGQPVIKTVPKRNFRNEHLPDLRAQYLKQMISVYSKKFDPIILEGAVKTFQDKEERNAIIYLFIPDAVLTTND